VTKVLYVEHNDDNLYMLKTRLELRGDFEVLAAEESEKGCSLIGLSGLRRHRPASRAACAPLL
jgi:CheY-like chemotaxis protein